MRTDRRPPTLLACMLCVALLTGYASIRPETALAIVYSYDAGGQLVGVDYGYGQSVSYLYDPAGNLSWREASSHAPDGDGVDDAVEETVTSRYGGNGDGNGDGTPDAFQPGVTSLPSFGAGPVITVANQVPARANTAVSALAANADAGFPSNVAAPYHLLAFVTQASGTGGSAAFSVIIPKNASVNGLWIKKRVGGAYVRSSARAVQSGLKTVLTLTVTDGGEYDLDGLVNGLVSLRVAAGIGGTFTPGVMLLLDK